MSVREARRAGHLVAVAADVARAAVTHAALAINNLQFVRLNVRLLFEKIAML